MALQSLAIKSKIDSKIRSNVITLKDIRTRKRFWLKPYFDPTRYREDGTKYYVDRWKEKIENPTDEQIKPYLNYDYMPLKFCPKWYYWQDSYSFLPTPDRWENIIHRVTGVVGRKGKDGNPLPDPNEKKSAGAGTTPPPLSTSGPATSATTIPPLWDTLENEDYYILASGENVMTVILQNRKQYDWIRPDCVVFFGRNTFSPEGLKWKQEKAKYEIESYRRQHKEPKKNKDGTSVLDGDGEIVYEYKDPVDSDNKVITWESKVGEDLPSMYWIRSWRYINTGTLFAEVILEKCYIWQYMGNWMNTWFNAKINKSELNNDHMSYAGFPIKPTHEPNKPVRMADKVHQKHWPVDEDWYVVRPKLSSDDTAYPVQTIEIEFPIISYWLPISNPVITLSDGKTKEIAPGVKEGWILDKDGKSDWGTLPPNYILDESIAPAHNCPACDACFDFCGDLRLKKAMNGVIGGKNGRWEEVPVKASWQPGGGNYFQVAYTVFPQNAISLLKPTGNISASVICDEKGKVITAVPSNIQLRFWEKSDKILETSEKIPSIIFLLDYYHEKIDPSKIKHWLADFTSIGLDAFGDLTRGAMITSSARRSPLNIRQFHWDYLPLCFKNEPHLLIHSTVQFYFFYKLLFTANCKHLWLRRKGGGYALGYRVITRSSISGILYCFESLDIFYKWELSVRGSIVNTSAINQAVASIQSRVLGAAKEALTAAVDTGADFFTGGMWSKGKKLLGFKGKTGDDKEVLEDIASSLKTMSGGNENVSGGDRLPTDPDSYSKQVNIGKHGSINEDKSEQEAQTERKAKATAKTKEKEVKPALFYTNTIDFSYDFWEFANRCVADPFMVRFEYSEVLYNNLVNNNNANPIQSWDIRGNRFCQIVKKGDFQAQVKLGFDPRGIFSGICARGTTWYDEGTDWDSNGNIQSDWWVPWVPQYRALQSYTLGATFNTQTQQGLEDTTQVKGGTEKKKGLEFNPSKAELGYVTYFRTDDAQLFKLIKQAGLNFHDTELWGGFDNKYCLATGRNSDSVGDKWVFCWGCNLSAIRNKGGTVRIEVPSGGQRILGIFDREHTATGPEIEVQHIPADKPWALRIEATGVFYVETETLGSFQTNYKAEAIQAMNIQNFATKENKEPVWDDKNTSAGSGIGNFEPDKKAELPDPEKEMKDKQVDKPESEAKEAGGDTERNFQNELEKEKEKQETEKNEREQQKEAEREAEREKERDREKEKQDERERQKEADKQREAKEKSDRDKKEKRDQDKRQKDAKERMEKAREKRDKDKKEKERGR